MSLQTGKKKRSPWAGHTSMLFSSKPTGFEIYFFPPADASGFCHQKAALTSWGFVFFSNWFSWKYRFYLFVQLRLKTFPKQSYCHHFEPGNFLGYYFCPSSTMCRTLRITMGQAWTSQEQHPPDQHVPHTAGTALSVPTCTHSTLMRATP